MSLFFLLLAVALPLLLLFCKVAGRILGFALGLVILSPFLLAMAFRKVKPKRASNVRT